MKRILLTFALFMALTLPGWAATYYVSPNGSNTAPYDTWDKAAKLPTTALSQGNGTSGPHTMYIAPGNYNTSLIFSSSTWAFANIVGTSAHGSTTPAAKGQVTITSSSIPINIWINGISLSNLSATTTGGSSTLYVAAANCTANNMYLYDSRSNLVELAGATNFNLTNSKLMGSDADRAVYLYGATSATLSYNILTNSLLKDLGYVTGVENQGTSTLTLKNNVIMGSTQAAIKNSSSGTIEADNNILAGGYTSTVVRTNGTINLRNNLIVGPPFSPNAIFSGTINIDSANIKSSFPKFSSHQLRGYIIPRVDDANDLAYAQELETELANRGMKGSYYIEASGVANGVAAIQALKDRGTLAIGCHSYSHSALATTGSLFSITKSGATINVDRTNNQIVISPGGTVSSFRTKTLAAIKTELQAFGCTVGASSVYDTTFGELMADSNGAKASPFSPQILIDTTAATGLYYAEITYPKSLLESLLTNYTCHNFATPSGSTSTSVETAIKNAGFQGNTNVSIDNLQMASINSYRIACFQADEVMNMKRNATSMGNNGSGLIRVTAPAHGYNTGDSVTITNTVGTTEANGTWNIIVIDTNNFDLAGSNFHNSYKSGGTCFDDTQLVGAASAIAEFVAQYGCAATVLAHDTAELTIDQWGKILDVWKQYSDITVTSADEVTAAFRSAPWTTSDGVIFNRTWTDQGDYQLTTGSPCIDAGIYVGLTADYLGNSIIGLPDIGAFEFQGSLNNTPPTVSISSPTNGATVPSGTVVNFSGTATDTESGNLTSRLTWTSSIDGSIGSGGSFSRILSTGTHTITASVTDPGGLTGSTSVTITVQGNTPPVVTINGPSDGSTVPSGSTIVFIGSATDTESGNLTNSLTWTSSIDGNIGAGGSFSRTLSSGTHTITASVTDPGGLTGRASITIIVQGNTPPVVTISSPTNGSTVPLGTAINFSGTATDTESGNLTNSLTWASNIDGNIGSGGSFSRTLSAGTHTITASVTDPGGSTGRASITIIVQGNTRPVVTISSPTNGSTVPLGTAINFSGTATDAESGNLTNSLAWTSNIDGNIGSGGSFSRTLSAGTHTLTASVTDPGGLVGSASVTITVQASSSTLTQQRSPAVDIGKNGTWTVFPASPVTKWDKVADSTSPTAYDSDSTYILLSGAAGGDLHVGFTPFNVPAGSVINYVRVYFSSKFDTNVTNYIGATIRDNNTNGGYPNTFVSPGANYATTSYDWPVNPWTGNNWTVNEINGVGGTGLESFGIDCYNSSGGIRITNMYIEVNYTTGQ